MNGMEEGLSTQMESLISQPPTPPLENLIWFEFIVRIRLLRRKNCALKRDFSNTIRGTLDVMLTVSAKRKE